MLVTSPLIPITVPNYGSSSSLSTLLAPTADAAALEYLNRSMAELFVYVQDEKQWLGLDPNNFFWRPLPDGKVRVAIAQHLRSYGRTVVPTAPKRARVRLLSQGISETMERALRKPLARLSSETHLGDFTLQTPGGAFDLRDGRKLRVTEFIRYVDTRCTFKAPAAGPMPKFDSLVSHLCNHDPAVIAWLWAYIGYACLGKPKAETMLILEGAGANGKATFCRAVSGILGSYAGPIYDRVLLEAGKRDHATAKYELRHKRLWVGYYLSDLEPWNEGNFKSLVKGEQMTAHPVRLAPIKFIPEGAFLFTANHLPPLRNLDPELAAQIRILPCTRPVLREDRILGLADIIIAEEAPAILARIMTEAKAVYAAGVRMPPTPGAMDVAKADAWEAAP